MSICVTESAESRRLLDQMYARDDRLEVAQDDMRYDFIKSIEHGDPDATPDWTGTCTDYVKARELGIPYNAKNVPRRPYSVAECLADALDYEKGPSLSGVVELLSVAMRSTDPIVSLAAKQFVDRAATKYAEMNAEVAQ